MKYYTHFFSMGNVHRTFMLLDYYNDYTTLPTHLTLKLQQPLVSGRFHANDRLRGPINRI